MAVGWCAVASAEGAASLGRIAARVRPRMPPARARSRAVAASLVAGARESAREPCCSARVGARAVSETPRFALRCHALAKHVSIGQPQDQRRDI